MTLDAMVTTWKRTSIEPMENSCSTKAKKAQQVQSKFKIMLINFFYANGIVHKEFVPPGHTENQQLYLKVLKRLCDSVQKKRPEM